MDRFSSTWHELPGEDIGDLYLLEEDGEDRFWRDYASWAGRGFTVRDEESTT